MDKEQNYDAWVADKIVEYLGERNFLSDLMEGGIPDESISGEDVTRVWGLIVEAAVNKVK
jgi:hypothetical protein